MRCETVQIKGQEGKPVNINKEDFDKSKHTLYVEPAKRGPKVKENK